MAAWKERIILVAAGIGLAAVSSALAEADRAGHDCAGEHCKICIQAETARNLLAGLCRGALFRFFAALAAPLFPKTAAAYPAAPPTPVSLKVKSLT